MTSKLTRERIELIANFHRAMTLPPSHDEIEELARMALYAMDSEPVAEVLSNRPGNDTSTIDRALPVGTQLYRHAQQLVVPPMQHWEELCREYPDMSIGDAIIRAAWWNHCRAAMLQAGNSPVIPDGLIAAVNRLLDSDGSRGCYSAIQCGDAHDEIERLLAAAPHDTPALNSVQSIVTVPGKWIPVSERMPEDDDFVYIWPRPDFGVELHVGQYCECSPKGDGWYAQVYEQNYGIDWHPINVTHWMPLPAAPQEVKGEHQIRDEMDMGARITSHRFKV